MSNGLFLRLANLAIQGTRKKFDPLRAVKPLKAPIRMHVFGGMVWLKIAVTSGKEVAANWC